MQLGPNRSASLCTTSLLPFLPEAAGPLLADCSGDAGTQGAWQGEGQGRRAIHQLQRDCLPSTGAGVGDGRACGTFYLKQLHH